MHNKGKALLLTAATTILVACSAKQDDVDNGVSAGPSSRSVSIMTFNVENLFDNRHDSGKNDRTFLPKSRKETDGHRAQCAAIEVARWRDQCLNWDWNDAIVERKLAVIAAAILQVDGGRGPDILALQEVENLQILERLRTDYLGAAQYRPAILIEGQDVRGIDVAFLSRLELSEPATLHEMTFAEEFSDRVGDTRGILEATFVLPDGALATGFSVHFPAPFHPTDMRISAYQQLAALLTGLPDDRPAFAAGDFNTTAGEDRQENLLERFVRPYWTVAHEQGCGDCRGTQYYARDDSWSFLDMILWAPAKNRGAQATWLLRGDSVQIANNAAGQRLEDGTPARFEMTGGSGVSDHWPLVLHIESK